MRRGSVNRRPAISSVFVLSLLLGMLPLQAGATEPDEGVTMTDNVTPVAHFPFMGGSEIDFDGERYLFAGQANLTDDLGRQDVEEGQHGGLRIIDTRTMRQVGELACPGTDNYVRYLDPEVYSGERGDREYVAMAHHGNVCTRDLLADDPNTRPGYGAFNGVMIVDVTNKRRPEIVSAVGHDSAHTVMPHPTRPYLYVLPGGLANGTSVPGQRVSPTGIVDLSDPEDPRYVGAYMHNAVGCHDLGFTHDGEHAYCAGFGETQVWDVSGDRIESPEVVGSIVNPAIQFHHNAVVSPSGRYMVINDEAFGFHSCSGEAADLYGSLWIYDISVPEVPVLAGRIAPPDHPGDQGFGTLYDAGPVNGWADSWCAAHNYNWVPGNDDVIVASWFAGGVTAHDMSDPMAPQLLAHYMPHDGVAWSGHYYGGYLVTNDMTRGVEILDVPELREAEGAARGDGRPGFGHGRQDAPGQARQDGSGQRGGQSAQQARPAAALGVAGPLVSSLLATLEASRPSTADHAVEVPRDRSDVLLPAELPPRPTPPRDAQSGGFCAIPGTAVG
jgi:hypothetical protein